MAKEKWSKGRSINGAKQIPAMSFDCSGWESHIPADQWSRGRSVNAAKQIPGSSTDCSRWDSQPPAWIVVRAKYAATTPKSVVAEHIFAVIEALKAMAPDLGFEHDERRSEEPPDQRRVKVIIAPTATVANLVARLESLIPKVRNAVPAMPIISLSVELDQPLAA